jgi:hypothetical protein
MCGHKCATNTTPAFTQTQTISRRRSGKVAPQPVKGVTGDECQKDPLQNNFNYKAIATISPNTQNKSHLSTYTFSSESKPVHQSRDHIYPFSTLLCPLKPHQALALGSHHLLLSLYPHYRL